MHLFDNDLTGLRESDTTLAGDKPGPIIDTGFARIGLTTCYDLRFPEMYQCLRLRGADMILAPSAFTMRTGQAHWDVLIRARALDAQSFLVCAAQAGEHYAQRQSYGCSAVVSPWGDVLGQLGCDDGTIHTEGECLFVEVDPHRVQTARDRIPLEKHRKEVSFYS